MSTLLRAQRKEGPQTLFLLKLTVPDHHINGLSTNYLGSIGLPYFLSPFYPTSYLSLSCLSVSVTLSLSPSEIRYSYIAQASLKLLPPKCQDHRCAPLYQLIQQGSALDYDVSSSSCSVSIVKTLMRDVFSILQMLMVPRLYISSSTCTFLCLFTHLWERRCLRKPSLPKLTSSQLCPSDFH